MHIFRQMGHGLPGSIGSSRTCRSTSYDGAVSLLLYTRGSVPYFRTYPGLYVPQPLLLRPAGDGTDLQATAMQPSRVRLPS